MVAKTKNSLTQIGKKSGREKFLEDRESLVKVERRSERDPTELITWLRILFCSTVYYSVCSPRLLIKFQKDPASSIHLLNTAISKSCLVQINLFFVCALLQSL